MQDRVFSKYDIRGVVGKDLVLEQAYQLGRAIALYFINHGHHVKTVAIGRDGRTDSEFINQELIRAMNDSGLDVINIGLCTTPALYFSLHTLSVQAGLMVTASHNSKEYNGIKICLNKESIFGSQIQIIKDYYKKSKIHKSWIQGSCKESPILKKYTQWLSKQFIDLVPFDKTIVIDCSSGPSALVIPQLINALKWKNVSIINGQIDPLFSCHEPDPSVEKNLEQLKYYVKKQKAEFGIAFDGDADRMVIVASDGETILGDKLIALFAQDLIKHNKNPKVVFDVKCSQFLPALLDQFGVGYSRVATGHSIIKKEMKRTNALLGGELSCHFSFNDKFFGFDDGIYSALRFCRLVKESGKNLEELLTIFPKIYNTPEIRIECSDDVQDKVFENTYKYLAARDARISNIDGIEGALSYGFVVVRRSNTQPMISLRFESTTQEGLDRVKTDFYNVLKEHIDPTKLENSMNMN